MSKYHFYRIDLSHVLTNRLLLSTRLVALLAITVIFDIHVAGLFVSMWAFSFDGGCSSLVRLGLPVDYLIRIPVTLLFLTQLRYIIFSASLFPFRKRRILAPQNFAIENVIVRKLSPYCAVYCLEANKVFSFQLESSCLLRMVVID